MRSILRKTLLGVLVAVFGLALTGCNPGQKKQFSINFKEAGPGYVTMVATVPYTVRCAYTITEVPMPVMNETFLNLSGKELYIYSDGEIQLCDFSIEENKKYYLYLVAILGENQFSQLYQWEFETGEFLFDELATVVAVAPDGYKMRITVPESVKNSVPNQPGSRAIRYAQSDIMMYNYYSGEDDYHHLLYNGARYLTEDTTIEYSDEKNWGNTGVDTNLDGEVDENDNGMLWNPIAPGEPVVFIAGEFEWMQEPEGLGANENHVVNGFVYPAGWKAGYYLPCIDSTKYWSVYKSPKASSAQTKGINIIKDMDVTSAIDASWTGAFQRKVFRTRTPAKLDAHIDVRIENLKSVNATVLITPDENVYRYLFTILDDGSYQQMLDLLDNHDEYLQWAVTSFFSMYNFGAVESVAGLGETSAPIAQVELTDFFYDVTASTKYHVLVTGMSGDIGSPQCFTHYEFTTPSKTKTTGPRIEVTALEELTTPFSAAFNVKCTTVEDNPADRCYYGANYYKDWILEINSGSRYETLGQTAQFTSAELAKINSEEGLTMYIPSIDGEKTRLVVVAFNDENISNGVDTWPEPIECPAIEDCTTPYYVPDEYFYSALLETDVLVGDWTMTALGTDGEELKTKVVIKREFKEGIDYPSSLPEDVKAIYKETTKWTDEEIVGYYNEFVKLANTYNEKRLSGQNKLLIEGWFDNDSQGRLDFMSPWDMFKSKEVVTVDVQSMFTEYGPKIHLSVAEGKCVDGTDSLYIESNRMFASPALNWSQSLPFYLAGRANQETNNTLFYYGDKGYFESPLIFPVKISEDRQTITIKPIHASNGLDYYPNLVGIDQMTSRYVAENPIVSEIVLTKGWVEEETDEDQDQDTEDTPSVKSSARNSSAIVPVGQVPDIVHKRRTEFINPRRTVNIKGEVMTVEKVNKNLEEFTEKFIKKNR